MEEDFARIDEYFAQNLRDYREAAGVSQEELARRMSERGYGFSQATIWKIEQSKRPVRIGEAVALAEALDLPSWRRLTTEPDQFKLGINVDRFSQHASEKYTELKAAAETYLDAQLQLAFAVREATDAGQAVHEHLRSWLEVPAEEAVIHARIEIEHADQDAERISREIGHVVNALREHGYAAVVDPADFEYE